MSDFERRVFKMSELSFGSMNRIWMMNVLGDIMPKAYALSPSRVSSYWRMMLDYNPDYASLNQPMMNGIPVQSDESLAEDEVAVLMSKDDLAREPVWAPGEGWRTE